MKQQRQKETKGAKYQQQRIQMISKTFQGHPMKKDQEKHLIKLHQETFDYLCKMRSVIDNKFVPLYQNTKQNTMCWFLQTSLKNKT